ncbi:NTP transferase domain-containing protein [Acetobacter sp.]|uniref:NTP transferase domain-containing protein n=1 Tax=Acetobacter sp. TaxID=440 RepID=UPI00344F9F67
MPSIFGLVLTGGHSHRTQTDKVTLHYGKHSQIKHVFYLLEPHMTRCFISLPTDQKFGPAPSRFPQIIVLSDENGPVAGLRAARHPYPDVA